MNLKTAKIRILDLDLKGCVYLNHFSHSHAVANFFKRISRLGDGIFWYTMLALTWLLQGLVYSLQIVYLVLGSLCGTLIYKVLKIKTIRPRPYQVHQVIRMGERPLDHFSFPSGHTATAFTIFLLTVYFFPKKEVFVIGALYAIACGYSRIYLGQHFPLDVAGGIMVAIFTLILSIYISNKIKK